MYANEDKHLEAADILRNASGIINLNSRSSPILLLHAALMGLDTLLGRFLVFRNTSQLTQPGLSLSSHLPKLVVTVYK